MRSIVYAVLPFLLLSACAAPSPEMRSAQWEDNAALVTGPTANE